MKPILVVCLAVLALLQSPADAQVKISEGPTFTDGGKLLIVSGSLSGLADKPAVVTAEANAAMVVVCRDSRGKVVKRHRNVPARMHFEQNIDAEMIAGGHAAFFLTSNPPAPDGKRHHCGKGHTSSIEDVRFKSALIKVAQEGTVVFRQEFKP